MYMYIIIRVLYFVHYTIATDSYLYKETSSCEEKKKIEEKEKSSVSTAENEEKLQRFLFFSTLASFQLVFTTLNV